MRPDLATTNATITACLEVLPLLLIGLGIVVFLWGKRSKLAALMPKIKSRAGEVTKTVRTTPASFADMSPDERFQYLYALRSWCDSKGHTQAVTAIDSAVLPVIVRDADANGGPTP